MNGILLDIFFCLSSFTQSYVCWIHSYCCASGIGLFLHLYLLMKYILQHYKKEVLGSYGSGM